MEARTDWNRVDLRLVPQQVPAVGKRRLAVALAEPAGHGLELESRTTRGSAKVLEIARAIASNTFAEKGVCDAYRRS